MIYADTDLIIPKYPLLSDVVTGNSMFTVTRANCSVNYKREEFLLPHRKDYYFFILVKQGNNRHWIDMEPHTLKANTFYFTTPHQVHLKEEPKPITAISVSFTDDFMALEENSFLKNLPIIQNLHNGHELNLNVEDVLFIEDLLEKIYAENQAKNSWQHSMLTGYMQVLLIYLSRLYNEQFGDLALYPERLLLKRYLSKIEEFYAQYHEVSAYADLLNLSAGHLSELVKEQSGKPAIAHIHKRLVLEAKRLLFHTDHSIKEIAFKLGFEDASYFNRFFKRIVTDTPLNYRTSIREIYH